MKKCPLCKGKLLREEKPELKKQFFCCAACRISIYRLKEVGSLGDGVDYFIDAKKMNLDGWLSLRADPPQEAMIIRGHFPSNAVRDEYIATIHLRAEEEVINLLGEFLIESGTYQSDESCFHDYLDASKTDPQRFQKLRRSLYYRRLVRHFMFGWKDVLPWEGITWILDLLPRRPDLALQGLNAYYRSHLTRLSDGMIHGWGDAEQLIRARFIGTPGTYDDTIKQLYNAGDRTFECLVERLYNAMGYKTELTAPQKDGGRDVIAWKDEPGHQQLLLVECKLRTDPVKVNLPRELLGVVSAEKANKGVLATNSRFTRGSRKFAEENPRIELLAGRELVSLMNQHLGANWPLRIDFLRSRSEEATKKI